jgi:DNA modification methylase
MMPDLKVETWPINRLVEYARNPRKNDDVLDRMVAAIHEFGFRIPIVARSDGTVVDGHLRLKAARKLNLPQVPVALADELTEAQVKAFRLLANRSANWASWDDDLLRLELAELQGLDFDLALTGFDLPELNTLLAERADGLTDPDDAPPLPETPVSQPGDVWLLGRHRLVCGDCTDPAAVDKALAGVKPHLLVSDPPYGVEYDPVWRNQAAAKGQIGQTKPSSAIGRVRNDNRADWREAWALFPGDVAYVWCASMFNDTVIASLEACGFERRAQIIWAKARFTIGRGHYHWQHEPCWYVVRQGSKGHWSGDRCQTTLWQITHNKSETGHSTQKPVECMKRPIENNSSPGQAVYEPFSGSGTTLVACEITSRVCHAIEIDGGYCDVAVQRWQAFAGKDATLDGDGRTFAQVAKERSYQCPAA